MSSAAKQTAQRAELQSIIDRETPVQRYGTGGQYVLNATGKSATSSDKNLA
jgi:hypothetical protein